MSKHAVSTPADDIYAWWAGHCVHCGWWGPKREGRDEHAREWATRDEVDHMTEFHSDPRQAIMVLAAWFEHVDPNEQMSWRELAEAMFAPECEGPLGNPEFVALLPVTLGVSLP